MKLKQPEAASVRRLLCLFVALLSCDATVAIGGHKARAHDSGRRAGQERQTAARPAGDVLVVLNEQFLNSLLEAILSMQSPPTFPLSRVRGDQKSSSSCASEITLLREAIGTRTTVRFADGRIHAPVAFRGSYQAPLLGCLKFEGWADTGFELAFEQSRQSLNARITVRDVHLKNVPSIVSDGITALVQETIDKRINPVEILRAEQLAARLPITPGNTLRLRAREVRHEITGKDLRLRIFYEVVSGE